MAGGSKPSTTSGRGCERPDPVTCGGRGGVGCCRCGDRERQREQDEEQEQAHPVRIQARTARTRASPRTCGPEPAAAYLCTRGGPAPDRFDNPTGARIDWAQQPAWVDFARSFPCRSPTSWSWRIHAGEGSSVPGRQGRAPHGRQGRPPPLTWGPCNELKTGSCARSVRGHNRKEADGSRHHAPAPRERRPLRAPDPSLEPQDEALHHDRAQRHLHHRPAAVAVLHRHQLRVHQGHRGQGRHDHVRGHQEAGPGGDRRAGDPRRDALRQPALAGRHAHQLPDRAPADQPPQGARRHRLRRRRRLQPHQEGTAPHAARADQARQDARRHPRHEPDAVRRLDRRHQQGAPRRRGGPQAEDPDHRDPGLQLRPRPRRLPDPGQRRRHPRGRPADPRDRRRRRRRPDRPLGRQVRGRAPRASAPTSRWPTGSATCSRARRARRSSRPPSPPPVATPRPRRPRPPRPPAPLPRRTEAKDGRGGRCRGRRGPPPRRPLPRRTEAACAAEAAAGRRGCRRGRRDHRDPC